MKNTDYQKMINFLTKKKVPFELSEGVDTRRIKLINLGLRFSYMKEDRSKLYSCYDFEADSRHWIYSHKGATVVINDYLKLGK